MTEYPKSSTSQNIYKQIFNEILSHYTHSTKIYTDASKTNLNVGITLICGEESVTYKAMLLCSIYSAKAFAIVKTLDYALKKGYNDFIILSDSLSTIISIKNMINPTDMAKLIHNLIALHYDKSNTCKIDVDPWPFLD